MRKFRTIFAVTLVALALCADRASAALPAVRPQISQVTRQAVRQFTRKFQHVLPALKIVQDRQDRPALPTPIELTLASPPGLHSTESTPFQFRLPPPAV